MRRGVARITGALTLALLSGASAAQAQIPITVDDAREPERSTGTWMRTVYVRLPGPAPALITVDWSILPGSATFTPGNDYFGPLSGSISFNVGEDSKPINVQVNGDTVNEWSPTLQQDEVFYIQLSNPSANATLGKPRGTFTLVDDDHPVQKPGVQFLSAVVGSVSPHGTNDGRVRLQWRVPAAQAPPVSILIRENIGGGCTFPVSTTDGAHVVTLSPSGAGLTQFYVHGGLPLGTLRCYSVIAVYGAGATTEIAQIKAKPFDASGSVAWSYVTGVTNAMIAPPTVGLDAIYYVDNSGVVHAMQRGTSPGGDWPTTWNPVAVGKPTQQRSAVVPMRTAPVYGDFRLFLGTDGGGIHAIDARDGHLIWSRSSFFSASGSGPLPSFLSSAVQAQPAGLLKGFGGANDMLLVGTNNGASNNTFYALNPATGADLDSLTDGLMGEVKGMAAVDYAANRVYFLTSSPSATFFALNLGPTGTPDLTLAGPFPGGNRRAFGSGSSGCGVMRNNRFIFGDSSGQVFALNLLDGTTYNYSTGDGQVKGFPWPDRRDTRLYFSTDGKVHGIRDDGGSFSNAWAVPLSMTGPSMVLQRPGTDELYAGDAAGRLVRINATTGAEVNAIVLETGVQIGAPSLDNVNALLIVGSASGTIYGVRAGF